MLAAMGLIVSYLSVFVNPSYFWLIGLAGLASPFLLLLNLLLLIFWIYKWRLELLIPLFAVALGIPTFSNFFQLQFSNNQSSQEHYLKVITYNVNLFRLFPWANTPPSHGKIFGFISDQNPDIVTLQEFYVVNSKFTQSEATSKLSYYYHISYVVKRRESAYGLATFSRFPIVHRGEIRFEDTANSCIYTDIAINGDTVRVYNSHLQSLRLRENNLNFLLNQTVRRDGQPMDEVRDISIRYRDAVLKRVQQVKMVTDHIASSPYPVIVCGDFNDFPISYNYRQMRKNLSDSFVEAGTGFGQTFRGLSPSLRIDYILYSPIFTALYHKNPHITYSDHYPVVVKLARNSPQ